MFLSLLFKALKADVNSRRTAAICKRALQARGPALCTAPGVRSGWERGWSGGEGRN